MSPLDIENIVAREGEERGWSAQTMAHVFELVSDLVGVEREACAKIADDRASTGEFGTWQAQEGLIIADEIRARSKPAF